MSSRRWIAQSTTLVLVVLATAGGALEANAQQSSAAAAPAPITASASLAELNAASRAEYARARAAALARVGPIIEVYEGDKLVLVRGSIRTEESFDPPESPNLKAVAHVPLAAWAALDLSEGRHIPDERIAELRTFRERIASARSLVSSGPFPVASLDRQHQMLDASIGILDVALANRSVAPSALSDFARRMAPLMLANVRDAARAQIDLLQSIASRWRSAMPAEDWSRLHVVIMGVHMARDGELAQQFFIRLLDEPGEGRRVVYAEGLFDEAKALELLGTHLIDGKAGAAFFGHDLRMHRDILADAARERIDELGIGP